MAKQKLADTGFGQLHSILQSRPNDRALRVDRRILEDVMVEMVAAAKKVEKMKVQDLLEEEETVALVAWAREAEREGGTTAFGPKFSAALDAARSIRKRIGGASEPVSQADGQ